MSRFDPLVRYSILRLKLAHPRWGPEWLRYHLSKRPGLRYLKLPSETAIGRYLHQWPRLRRRRQQGPTQRPRPNQPTAVHQQWQIDFKTDIKLQDGSRVNLHTVRDPVGEACLSAVVFPAQKVKQRVERVSLEQVRPVLRRCFAQWHTLPDEIQTDGETVLVANGADAFPSTFTLWLAGLGISHQVIRSGRPTDNAEVERCHRTLNDQEVLIRFDPTDRHFVFYPPDQPDDEIGRQPARNLEVEDLTGLSSWPVGLLPHQLPLPFCQGVTF